MKQFARWWKNIPFIFVFAVGFYCHSDRELFAFRLYFEAE